MKTHSGPPMNPLSPLGRFEMNFPPIRKPPVPQERADKTASPYQGDGNNTARRRTEGRIKSAAEPENPNKTITPAQNPKKPGPPNKARAALVFALTLFFSRAAAGADDSEAPFEPSAAAAPMHDFFEGLKEEKEAALRQLNSLLPSLAAHPAAPLKAQAAAGALARIKDSSGHGSGFVMRDEKTGAALLATAGHVIRHSDPSNLVFLDSGGRPLSPVKVWSFSLEHDLILFELEGYGGPALRLPASLKYAGGELYILGFPEGLQRMIKGRGVHKRGSPFFTFIRDYELLSDVHGVPQGLERALSRAGVQGSMEGSSGGPAVNKKGELAGAVLIQDSSNYLIQAAGAEALRQLLEDGPVEKLAVPFFLAMEESFPRQFADAGFGPPAAAPSKGAAREIQKFGVAHLSLEEQIDWFQTLSRSGGKPLRSAEMLPGKTLPQLRRLAEKGSASAQFLLGSLLSAGPEAPPYISRNGAPEDKKEAAYWFRRAAEQGHIDAQFRLAMLLSEGEGALKAEKAAARWLKKAARGGHAEAQFRLAEAFDRGEGLALNRKKAAYWYKKPAGQGHFPAQIRLAAMLDEGDGIRQNKKKAARWLRHAAENDLEDLQKALCWTGAFPCSWAHLEKGVELWFQQAKAQFRLAEMLSAGEGLPMDKEEAAYWFRRASEGGVLKAVDRLSALLEDVSAEGRAGIISHLAEQRDMERGIEERFEGMMERLVSGLGLEPPKPDGGPSQCRGAFILRRGSADSPR